jgi:hypothetical protein
MIKNIENDLRELKLKEGRQKANNKTNLMNKDKILERILDQMSK